MILFYQNQIELGVPQRALDVSGLVCSPVDITASLRTGPVLLD
jgi:hypothetical protein